MGKKGDDGGSTLDFCGRVDRETLRGCDAHFFLPNPQFVCRKRAARFIQDLAQVLTTEIRWKMIEISPEKITPDMKGRVGVKAGVGVGETRILCFPGLRTTVWDDTRREGGGVETLFYTFFLLSTFFTPPRSDWLFEWKLRSEIILLNKIKYPVFFELLLLLFLFVKLWNINFQI